MARTTDWPTVLMHLPEDLWERTETGPQLRIRIGGYPLVLTGLEVTYADDIQQAVSDPDRENHLLGIYDPEEPWQTWRGFDADYALYATPDPNPDTPAALDIDLDPADWESRFPELDDADRKLIPAVVAGHCALHLEARRVTGPDQDFVAYPEDREHLHALAGWDGPYPTLRLPDGDFVLFAYPHGD